MSRSLSDSALHRVVIVGGGFGGLAAARALRKAPVRITLVDRRNFHLFQPLLYQVATGGLSPANIAAPLRSILRRQENVEILLGDVTGFDVAARRVLLADGAIPYASLIVAAGARHSYFGKDHWECFAPGLKTIEDATEIRKKILFAFEAAEREADPRLREAYMTFVIVGAGPTGVELAGALAEISRYTLKRDFRRIEPADARIILLDAVDRVLNAYPEELSAKALRSLDRLGVAVRTGCIVTDVRMDGVSVKCAGGSASPGAGSKGDEAPAGRGASQRREREETIPARTVLWAAGVQASPLALELGAQAGAEVDRVGRVVVGPDLALPGRPDIFVIGDMAHAKGPDGQPLPGVAPVALQQGKYVARVIADRLAATSTSPSAGAPAPFRYRDPGSMATIGRAAAVAVIGRLKLNGLVAWLLWLFVHLMQLARFENRLLVMLQWAWSYFTFNRSARLITGVLPGQLGSPRR